VSLCREFLTRHAQSRMQQRGVSTATLDALLKLGRVSHVGSARDIVFFDKKARARLARAGVLPGSEADRVCKSYAIVESAAP
jgi:hypothetical protein